MFSDAEGGSLTPAITPAIFLEKQSNVQLSTVLNSFQQWFPIEPQRAKLICSSSCAIHVACRKQMYGNACLNKSKKR